jgi:hypothetical protein
MVSWLHLYVFNPRTSKIENRSWTKYYNWFGGKQHRKLVGFHPKQHLPSFVEIGQAVLEMKGQTINT